MTCEEIQSKYNGCSKCINCLNQKKVFGWGNITAKIAIVGEGPGKDEVANGIPFVGAAGQLLDKILGAVGLKREDLYFTNAVLCRTNEKNRTPTKSEYTNCRLRLFDELNMVKPKMTLLVGSTALKTIMGDDYSVMETHGKWFTKLSPPCFAYFSLLHPAWILHSVNDGEIKAKKQIMWNDIRQFAKDISIYEKISI
jgi:uracil-DNA glycosylase